MKWTALVVFGDENEADAKLFPSGRCCFAFRLHSSGFPSAKNFDPPSCAPNLAGVSPETNFRKWIIGWHEQIN